MKIVSVLVLATASGLVAGAAATRLFAPARPADSAPMEAELARVSVAVDEVARGQQQLRDALEALGRRVASAPAASPAAPTALGEIERVVDRALDERGAAQAAATESGKLQVGDVMRRLLDPGLGRLEREELWQAARAQGLLDELVAAFEARAAAAPHDPDRQVELGEAYLQKIFEVGNGPLAGVWASKADGAFDRALEVDPQHWDARFTKAVSLSFWPPIFGKQAEAIGHFKTLIEQQASQPSQPKFAQSWLMLGNLYMQQGQSELAKQAYQAGLEKFPDDEALAGQLSQLGG